MKRLILGLAMMALIVAGASAIDFGANFTIFPEEDAQLYGLTIRSVGEAFIGFDLTAMTPALSDAGNPLENLLDLINNRDNINTVWFLPTLLLNASMKPVHFYAGAGPFIYFAKNQEGKWDFSLVDSVFGKVGAQLNVAFVGAYAEAGVLYNWNFGTFVPLYTFGAVLNF
ncbi:MAG: hypothetical protein QHH01_03125 [Spirochaetales bacterium]|nr:hypothetical protein [Spirochaetales bacterium]